jgi:hypothetical protein
MAQVFNNGNGGTICDSCRTMIKSGSRQIHEPVLDNGQEFCSVKCQKLAQQRRLIYGFEKRKGEQLAATASIQETTESVMLGSPEDDELPPDYEVCSLCGFDHEYDVCDSMAARKIQEAHKPSS